MMMIESQEPFFNSLRDAFEVTWHLLRRQPSLRASRKERELMILLICFVAAYILNVIGIVQHGPPAIELVTQLHLVVLITLIIYGFVVVLRVLYFLISRLWIKKKYDAGIFRTI